jgi:hypothetical protein
MGGRGSARKGAPQGGGLGEEFAGGEQGIVGDGDGFRGQAGRGLHAGGGDFVGIAEARGAEETEAFEDEVANLGRVVDAVKYAGVERVAGGVFSVFAAASASGGLHAHIG